MAQSNHDDLADALSRMAAGDAAPSAREPSPLPKPPANSPPLKSARPITTRPVPTRPVAPGAATPIKPQSSPIQKTPRPSSPATPTAPTAKKQRPSAPTIRQATVASTEAETDGGQSTGLSQLASGQSVIDDDDSVIVPAPDASVFITKKPLNAAAARAAVQKRKSLEYRRTLIPVLLTSGILLAAFGVLKYFSGPDSMLQTLPSWVPITLISAGVVLLVLAVINMISVKDQLAADKK